MVNMKVERYLYGMQTANGKIEIVKTSGVNNLLTSKSQESIRKLTVEDSRKYLWFKTEQTVAYPVVIEVSDKLDGGRTWVQNQTFLVNIHEFISYALAGKNPFEALVQSEFERFPDEFNAVNV